MDRKTGVGVEGRDTDQWNRKGTNSIPKYGRCVVVVVRHEIGSDTVPVRLGLPTTGCYLIW